jgi:hypothetical protein
MVVVSFGVNFCLYWNVEQRRKKSTPEKCFSSEYPSAEAPPRRMKTASVQNLLSPGSATLPLCHLDRSGEISVLTLILGNVFREDVDAWNLLEPILFPGHPDRHSFSDAGRPQNGEAKNDPVKSIYIS